MSSHPPFMRVLCGFFLILLGVSLNAQRFQLEKLPAPVNTPNYDEISPVLSLDGNTLYYTRVGSPDRARRLLVDGRDVSTENELTYQRELRNAFAQLSGNPDEDPVRSRFNQDVWIAQLDKRGNIARTVHPGPPLNNALPNSICAVSPLPNTFVIINQFSRNGDMRPGFSTIHASNAQDWTFPEPLRIKDFYSATDGVSLTMSADGQMLILSLQREGSLGSNDLYVSRRLPDGSYDAPAHLGGTINSAGREATPSLSADQRTLYFSSDRGTRGSDIYYVRRLDERWLQWSAPKPLRAPINSNADDSQPYFNTSTGYLYFTSKRDGSSDIYRVKIAKARPLEDVIVRGRIIDSSTGKPMPATVANQLVRGPIKQLVISKDGKFRLRVPQGKNYVLSAEQEGYLGHSHELLFSVRQDKKEYEVDLYLDPLRVDAEIKLPPIYFVRSKATIRNESTPALRELLRILEERPNLHIRIEGHTDDQGRPKDLQRLSNDRADAILQYLLNAGVAQNRLEAKGYGGTRPKVENTDESTRSQNRRVEIRITQL